MRFLDVALRLFGLGRGKPTFGFARTVAEVIHDESYRMFWKSPASGIEYYLKAVPTSDMRPWNSDPPLHRRAVMDNEPESYVYIGVSGKQIVDRPPESDLTLLGLRIALGKDLPFIHRKPFEL
jgi:hypothetical protein